MAVPKTTKYRRLKALNLDRETIDWKAFEIAFDPPKAYRLLKQFFRQRKIMERYDVLEEVNLRWVLQKYADVELKTPTYKTYEEQYIAGAKRLGMYEEPESPSTTTDQEAKTDSPADHNKSLKDLGWSDSE